MEKDRYEKARDQYKPNEVKILFVGESRRNSGKFFYLDDTYLYQYTKNAFERLSNITNFSLKTFQQLGCWLYDVCEIPVNDMPSSQRRALIKKGIPKLDGTICKLKPDYIIVVKKGDMREIVFNHICQNKYINNKTAFNLPFPNCGHQKEYEEQLYEILKKIL